jgi:general secretion pathway protein C
VKRISLPTAITALRFDAAAAARWTTALLVIALGVGLAQLTWLLLPVPPGLPAPITTAAGTAGTAAAPRLESVAALNLFGAPEASVQPAAPINAPETSLNLTLRGLFAAVRKEAAFAIIAEGGGNERHFRIGDKVAGGAMVQDILPDRVVLERAGRYETLRLPRERLDAAAQGAGRPPAALTPAMTGQLRELRNTMRGNPQELLNLAEMQPVVQDGQLRGYRIRPRRHEELFRAAGLSPNDVITGVNGIPVTDPAQFGALSAQLSNASTLLLSVERPNGARDEISIDLN